MPHPARPPRTALLLGAVAFLLALPLLAVRAGGEPFHPPVSPARAEALVRANPEAREHLAETPAPKADVVALDEDSQRVTLLDDGRVVVEAVVGPRGRVEALALYGPGYVRWGSRVLHAWPVLLVMVAAFVVATAAGVMRHVRNLDVALLVAFALIVKLLDGRWFALAAVLSTVLLVALLARVLLVAVEGPDPPPSTLAERIGARLEPGAGARLGRLAALAAGAVIVITSWTSTGATDVAQASIGGATRLLHGELPYGHLDPSLVHGDTYPLLAYVAYVPAALVWPWEDPFSSSDGALLTAALATLLAAWGVARSAALVGTPQAGTRIGIAYLLLPPVAIGASTGGNDAVLAVALAWLLPLAARPVASGALLAAGAWIKVVPVLLIPPWLAREHPAGRTRVLAGLAAVTLACCAVLVAYDGIGAIGDMVDAMAFQLDRGVYASAWERAHVPWLQPAAQAAALGLTVLATAWLWLDRPLGRDPARLAALLAALLLAVQIAASNWAYTYLAWTVPLVAVALLAPVRTGPGARATGAML
jgi:hypothetical protein